MAGFYESLNRQNYLKIMNGSYQNYGLDPNNINQLNGQGDSITPTISLADEIRNASATAEKAVSEENHDDDPSWFQKARNFILAPLYGIEEGILNFADGIGDLAMGITGAIAGAVGNHGLERQMKNGMNTDWQASVVNTTKQLNDSVDFINALDPTSDTRKMWTGKKNGWETLASQEASRQSLNNTKYNAFLSKDVADVVGSVAQGIGEMVPSIVAGKWVSGAVGAFTGSAKAARTANIVAQSTIGALQGAGKGYSKVAKEDGDLARGSGYAAIKGLLGGAKSAFSASIGGTLSDQARNFMGVKAAQAVLGKGGSEVLANFVGNATSIVTDSIMDGAMDAAEDLLDPALSQIYDDDALKNAYGEDNWKQTLVNASKTFMTSAITSAIVDTVKVAANSSERKNYAVEAKEKTIEDSQKKAVKQAVKDVKADANASEDAKQTLEAVNHLNERAEANKETIKQAYKAVKKAGDVLNGIPEGIDEYKKATENLKAKMDDYVNATNTANEISDQIMDELGEYKAIHQETLKNTDADVKADVDAEDVKTDTTSTNEESAEAYSQKKAEAPTMKENERDIDYLSRNGKRKFYTKKDGTKGRGEMYFTDIGGGVEAKISSDGRIVYRSDDTANVATLMNTKSQDNADGRIVMVDGSLVGNKKDVSVDTKTADEVDVKAFSKTLTDTFNYNTSYYNKDTGEMFVENTNGLRFMFKGNVFQGMVNEKPAWATESAKQLFKTRGDFYTNNQRLVQQASTIGYVGKEKVNDFIDGFIVGGDDKVSELGGGKDHWTDRTTTAYNLAKDDNERGKIISTAVDELYSKANENGYSSALDKEIMKADLKSWLDMNQKHTEGQKTNLEYKAKLGKLCADIQAIKQSKDNFNKQKNAFIALKNKLNPTTKGGTAKPYETTNAYIGQYSSLKFTDSIGGIDPSSLRSILGGQVNVSIADDGSTTMTGIKYTQADLEKYGLDYLYDPSTENLIDNLMSHFDKDGNYVGTEDGTEKMDGFTMEDSQLVTGLLSRLNKLSNLATYHNKTARKMKYMPLVLGAESLQYGNKGNSKLFNKAQSALNSTLGLNERMKIYFGEGSDAYNLLFTDVYNAHLDTNQKTAEIISDFQRIADTYSVDTDTTGSKKVEFDYNGEKVKMKMGEAMSIYLNSMSPENLSKMMNDGYSTSDGTKKTKHMAIGYDFLEKVESALPENVRNFVTDVFQNGYNGKCRQVLNDYSIKKYGYAQYTDTNYVHRSIDAVEQTGTSSPDMLMKAFEKTHGDLGQSISIKRNGNRGALNIGDFFQEYASYARSVAENVSMDAVRDLNVAMNMRGSQDYKTDSDGNVIINEETGQPERGYAPDSVYTAFSRVNGGKQFIDNYMAIANGLNPTKSGKAMKLFNNAAASPIGANPMTYLKMYLDPLRMIGKEVSLTNPDTGEVEYRRITWGNFFNGLLNAFNERTMQKNGTDTFKTIQNSSRYYMRANQEQFAVSDSVFGAKMSGWKNKLFYAPLEQANNAMMSHVVFPMLQSFAKSNGYGDIGSDTNTEQALNMFDALSVTALSNGDSLDVSDLRAGRAAGGGTSGSILKVVFGIYGGDSQKKMEQISDVILGNSRSKRRVEGYQAIIDKYEGDGGQGSVISEYKQREDEAKKNYEKVKSLYEENVDRDGKHTKKSEFDVMVAKAKYEEAKSQTESVKSTIQSMKSRIIFEKEHVQSAKNNAVKAGYVLSAFAVASALEAGIEQLGSFAKNKDDEEKLKTYAKNMGSNMLVDWIPYVGTITNAVKYSSTGNPEFTPLQLQGLSKALGSFNNVVKLISSDDKNSSKVASTIYDAIVAVGYNMGIPVKNIMDYAMGAITRVEDMTGGKSNWANQLSMRLNGYSSSTLKSKATSYLNSGNLTKATEYTQANMAFFKAGSVNWRLAREIAKTEASVRDCPNVDSAAKDRFMNIYSKSNNVANRFIASSNYTSLTDAEKKKALTKIYSAYYSVSEAIMDNDETKLSSTLAKALYAYYKGKRITKEYRALLKQYRII